MTKAAFAKLVAWLACGLVLAGCWREAPSDARLGAGASFVALGSLPGYAASEAAAVSADGRVVVGTSTSTGGFRQAFRWSAMQGIAGLGFLPGGTFSSGKGVSADGAVVLGDADGGSPSGSFAFRWTVGTGLVPLPGLRGSNLCAAGGVSADGGQVTGTCASFTSEGFRWSQPRGTIGLGRFGTGSNATSSGTAISADGDVIGGAGHPVLAGAIVWQADNSATIGGNPQGDSAGVVTGLSADGSVAVGASVDANHHARAFRWSAGGAILPLPRADPFIATYATSVSGDAARTVGWAETSEGEIAILWDDTGGVRILSEMLSPQGRVAALGWRLLRARAISNDGRTIVGQGTNPSGEQEAWLIALLD